MQDVDVSHDTHPQVVSATEPDLKSEQRGKDLHSETSPSTSDTLPRVLSPVDLGGKREEIRSACRSRDVAALARLSATPGGFLADDLRYEACTFPIELVQCLSIADQRSHFSRAVVVGMQA